MRKLIRADETTPYGSGYNIRVSSSLMLILFCLLILTFSQKTYAKGVSAGTLVSNTVIVTYNIDDKEQTPIESSPTGNSLPGIGKGQATAFKVDRKIDLIITGNNNANVKPGDTQAVVTFTLLNEGNDIQEFGLIPDNTISGDDFDPKNCSTRVTAVSGSALPGVALPSTGNIKLKADQQASISVRCDIPLDNAGQPILSGQKSQISLYASAVKNSDGTTVTETNSPDTAMNVETVFADNSGTDDIDRDATYTARRTYTASSSSVLPELKIDKSIVAVRDPQGGTDAISGSEVTYKISINTSGSGFIDNVLVTDPTPQEMTYKTGSIRLDSVAMTDTNDSDAANFNVTNNQTVTVNLGSINAGSQHDIELTYIIN